VKWIGTFLRGRLDRRVALVGGPSADALAAVLLERWPGRHVVVVPHAEVPPDAHAVLASGGPYSLVVDVADGTAAEQVAWFARAFLHAGAGGWYLAVRVADAAGASEHLPDAVGRRPGDRPDEAVPAQSVPRATLREYVAQARAADGADASPSSSRHDLAHLGARVGEVDEVGPAYLVRNARRAFVALREAETNLVLERRPDLGSVLHRVPGMTFDARASYRDPAGRPDPHRLERFDVPERAVRLYEAPTYARGQIVTRSGLVFSDTFRHHLRPRLANVYLQDVAEGFVLPRKPLGAPEELDGDFFHFDCEWPGHFGHLLTDQLSRLWAWDEVRRRSPGVRLLTSLPKTRGHSALLRWETDLLSVFGVGPDDVTVFDAPVKPERLYAATPMFSCPEYVDPRIVEVWDRVGTLSEASSHAVPGRRLFVSRRPELKRSCHNAPEVEAFFTARGFDVVYPEDHTLGEQITLFREAEVVAGFAGSGMFSLAFCQEPKRVLLISSEAYTARNEWMIAAVRGHEVGMVWATPDVPHPPGRWSAEAFGSGFTLDLARGGPVIDALL
jgi:capsular polysaccharide biosynthesis protein